ncbi:eIF3-S7 [Symbiodinium natans]|uniref:eIF3-S7 protein n=1 Tax=Symbiodinium natans TaxID=878477 RepID=A0A812J3W6_9DINO|nr:eIF3-S7 [Symbiodinium natans]
MALAADVVAGSFGELAAAVQAIGLQRHLPTIASCGVNRIGELQSAASSLLAAGVPAQDIEILVTIRPPRLQDQAPEPLVVPGRPDAPVRRREASASLSAALEAAVPANRKRALDALDADVLASSSRRPVESRLRTWRRLAAGNHGPSTWNSSDAWRPPSRPAPTDRRKTTSTPLCGSRRLTSPVSPLVKKAIRRYVRSATRGLPGANLKDAFPLDAVGAAVAHLDLGAFRFEAPAHFVDVLIVATWFMLREIEIVAARVSDIQLSEREVCLAVPLHKVAQGGERDLTRRSLRCVCEARVHPLCPARAATAPTALFPGPDGAGFSKKEFFQAAAGVLATAGVECFFVDTAGRKRPRFQGHLARVAGATFLALAAGAAAALPAIVDLTHDEGPSGPPVEASQQEGGDAAASLAAPPSPQSDLPGIVFLEAPDVASAIPPVEEENTFIMHRRNRRLHRPDPHESSKAPSPTEEVESPSANSEPSSSQESRGGESESHIASDASLDLGSTDASPTSPRRLRRRRPPQRQQARRPRRQLRWSRHTASSTRRPVGLPWMPSGPPPPTPIPSGAPPAPGVAAGVGATPTPFTMGPDAAVWQSGAVPTWPGAGAGSVGVPTAPTADVVGAEVAGRAAIQSAAGVAGARRLLPFDDLARLAGAAPPVVAYLRARGVDRTSTLALIAATQEDLRRILLQPFVDGIDVDGTHHKLDDQHKEVAAAIVTHMWTEVEAYSRLLDGARRRFPTQTLLGAEEVGLDPGRSGAGGGGQRFHRLVLGEGAVQAPMIEQVVDFWSAIGWTLAMDLRLGKSFGEASKAIMEDHALFYEVMARPPKQLPRRPNPDHAAVAETTDDAEQPTKGGSSGQRRDDWGSWNSWSSSGGQQWGREAQESQPKKGSGARGIIILSAFDGVGAAPWLVSKEFGEPLLAMAWETDPVCVDLSTKHMPWLQHRGDIIKDFSRVAAGRGHDGDRGGLFSVALDFYDDLVQELHEFTVVSLWENVVMKKSDADVVSQRLQVQPVLACGSDFGWISRPRLWWATIDWSQFSTHPLSGEALRWSLKEGWRKLRIGAHRAAEDDLNVGSLRFDDAVRAGRVLLPCATTPAEDENGRPAPKSCRGRVADDVRDRWLRSTPICALALQAGGDDVRRSRAPRRCATVSWGTAGTGASRLLSILVVAASLGRTEARNPPVGPPSSSTLQWLQALRDSALWPMDPPPRARPAAVDETISEADHWRMTMAARHALTTPPALEPALEWVLKVANMWRHDLRRIRRGVVQELKIMVDDMEDTTKEWLACRCCSTSSRDAGYPDVKSLADDLADGFDMLGEIKPGPGWKPRDDDRYSNPATMQELRSANRRYLLKRLPTARPGAHSDALLAELVEERRLGRVIGPARAPADWPIRTVALPHIKDMTTLVEPPDHDIFVAASFPIIQVDENGDEKLRRGKDWRRSGHNSTVKATDVPTHHFVGDFVDLARRFAHLGVTPLVLGHDLLSAYRQWAVKHPAHSGTFLATEHGVLLRHLLLLAVGHYVDDFNALDFPEAAQDAHDAFSDVFSLLGLKTKASKALSSDQLAPHVAHRLAGKLAFLTQAIFGALGKAALKPIYARSADAAAASDDRLSAGLRAALMALPVLYADAFFQEGDVVHKAGFVPRSAQARPTDRWTNGWGFVLVIDDEVFYSRGVVPAWFLRRFASRKAFIYVLEIVAQLLPLLAFGERLPSFWTAYIDNAAGQWALLKGYGKDDAVNGVLSAFWASAARHCWFPEFVRVPSKANVSDAVSRDDLRQASAEGWSFPSTTSWTSSCVPPTTSSSPPTKRHRRSHRCLLTGFSVPARSGERGCAPPRRPRFSADWTALAHVALCRKTTYVRPAFILGLVRSGACRVALFMCVRTSMRRTTQPFVASRLISAPTLFHPGASRPPGASGGCRMRPPRAVPGFRRTGLPWRTSRFVAKRRMSVQPSFWV